MERSDENLTIQDGGCPMHRVRTATGCFAVGHLGDGQAKKGKTVSVDLCTNSKLTFFMRARMTGGGAGKDRCRRWIVGRLRLALTTR